MKKYLFFLIALLLTYCDYFGNNDEEFVKAYKKILIVREKFKGDSLKTKADKEIKKIYAEYGFTEQSFREKFFELATKDSRKFYELLDSIRNQVRDELNQIHQERIKKDNQKSKDTINKPN